MLRRDTRGTKRFEDERKGVNIHAFRALRSSISYQNPKRREALTLAMRIEKGCEWRVEGR